MPESATTIARTLSVPAVFGDHMVLQRHKPIHLWGEGEPGSIVSVILGDGEVKKASVDDDGDWSLTLPPHEAARGLDLLIADSDTALAIHDVAVGEVWIAGGQSNMEFHLEFDADRQEVLDGPMNLDIRFFDVPEISYSAKTLSTTFRTSITGGPPLPRIFGTSPRLVTTSLPICMPPSMCPSGSSGSTGVARRPPRGPNGRG